MLYVDYTECVPKKNMKFHGGANYGKRMIKLLAESERNLVLLIPNGFTPSTEMDKELFSNQHITIQPISDLNDFRAENEDSILYIPMIQTRRLTVIRSLKINNPNLKVYATIHGIRRLDLTPDWIDVYYHGSSRKVLFLLNAWIKYFVYGLAYRYVFKKYIPMYDRIITVSNDSMQKIQRLSKPRDIRIYYEGSVNSDSMLGKSVNMDKQDFALMVSGGREEKNLLRTLIGFQKFKLSDTNNKLSLIVTGVNSRLCENLMRCEQLDKSIIEKFVIFKEYVSDTELIDLYSHCKYVVYLSKSEGFGLPLIEACLYGAPCLAASITAMPEVLGSAIEYADPYKVDSIANGFRKLESTEYRLLQDKILRRRETIIKIIKDTDLDFVVDFK